MRGEKASSKERHRRYPISCRTVSVLVCMFQIGALPWVRAPQSASAIDSPNLGGAVGCGRIGRSSAKPLSDPAQPFKMLQLVGNTSSHKAKGGRGRPGERICDAEGCHLVAKYGDPAGGGPVRCRAHKMPSHHILRGWTPCLHAEGCTKKSSFGFRSGRPIFCQAHKTSAHVSLSFRGRKCLFDGCTKQPSFGSLVDGRTRFCQKHKGANDVFLRLVRCRHPEGCLKAASFASRGCKVPTTCVLHRRSDHVRIVGVKNDTSLAQTSVCPMCLRKISRRNMAKHRDSTQCRARAATPYIKHKRCRMGRDVTDALKGRKGRRHPTLCETPALHAEHFMDHVADDCFSESQATWPAVFCDHIGGPFARQTRRRGLTPVLNTSSGICFIKGNSKEGEKKSEADFVVNADQAVAALASNQTNRVQRSAGSLQLRPVALRCPKCVSNKRSAAYCAARMHPCPPVFQSGLALDAIRSVASVANCSRVLREERRSVYLGVGWCAQKKKWRARFGRIHVGFFDDEHEAAQARERHRTMSIGKSLSARKQIYNTSHGDIRALKQVGTVNFQALNVTWLDFTGLGNQDAGRRGWKCVHGRQRSLCVPCGGVGICKHKRRKRLCRECSPSSFCPHGKLKARCALCPGGGSGLCFHGRQKGTCSECGTRSSYCCHDKQKSRCAKGCGGGGLCEHGRRRSICGQCKRASMLAPLN